MGSDVDEEGLRPLRPVERKETSRMADASKLQALRAACARDAGLRARLEHAPDEVLREYGVVPGEGVTVAAAAKAILGGELSEVELGGLAGGLVESVQWSGSTGGDD